MSRCAAPRTASGVVLPAPVLAVGLGVSVGVLVVVICTNRSVQKATPREAPRQARDRFPETKSPEIENAKHRGASRLRRDAPSRPGVKGALRGPLGKPAPRSVTAPPGRSEPPRGLRGRFDAPLEEQKSAPLLIKTAD